MLPDARQPSSAARASCPNAASSDTPADNPMPEDKGRQFGGLLASITDVIFAPETDASPIRDAAHTHPRTPVASGAPSHCGWRAINHAYSVDPTLRGYPSTSLIRRRMRPEHCPLLDRARSRHRVRRFHAHETRGHAVVRSCATHQVATRRAGGTLRHAFQCCCTRRGQGE